MYRNLLSSILLNNSCNKYPKFIICYLAEQAKVLSFYFRKLLLSIFIMYLYHCIPISEFPFQLRAINKIKKSLILIILHNDFRMPNNLQI